MATIKKESKGFSFLDLDKALSKIDGFEMGSILETNTFSETDEYIGTGSYIMNAQISGSLFGGVPNNRSTGLVGDPETGKTYLCLNIAREAQKMGYDIIYCETEGAIDKSTAEKLGCDTKRIRYQPIKTVNDFKRFTVQVIDLISAARKKGENPKIMMFLDSLGMLTTEKEINDAMSGKDASDMGLKAKQMRAMFRLITLDLAGNKIPLVVTNHTTTGGIGSYTGPTKESAGGLGPIFSMSTVLMISKKFQTEENDKKTKTGVIITSKPMKTRKTIPKIVSMHIGFASGINSYVGLEEYCNWNACGIERGKILTEKEYAKLGITTGRPFEFINNEVDKETGEVLKTTVERLVFNPSETGRWCVKHLGKSLTNGGLLFNNTVFTEEVLRNLDANVIQKEFRFPDYVDSDKVMMLDGEEVEIEND